MKMSELFIPTSQKKPAKVKDAGLIKLIQAGYGLWNPNEEVLMLMPLGVGMRQLLVERLLNSIEEFQPQNIDTSLPEGAMAVAVRQLKRSVQLPMLFSERKGDILEVQAYSEDLESSSELARAVFRSLGVYLSNLGIKVQRWDSSCIEGDRSCIVTPSEKGSLSFRDGLCCPCGWSGDFNSQLTFSGNEKLQDENLKEVHTPGVGTIESLCEFLSTTPDRTVKTMCYMDEKDRMVVSLIRGDRKLSIEKLESLVHSRLRSASDADLKNILGDLAGYLGPIGLPASVKIIADQSVEGIKNALVGANKKDYHLTGASWGRDFSSEVADISAMTSEDSCPLCGEVLSDGGARELVTLELWNNFADREESLTFVDEERKKRHPASWIIKVNLVSLMAAIFEKVHYLPKSISPFEVQILPLDDESVDWADTIYTRLSIKGVKVLLDDRKKKVKSSQQDLDVMKLPWALTVDSSSGDLKMFLRDSNGEVYECDEENLLKNLLQ